MRERVLALTAAAVFFVLPVVAGSLLADQQAQQPAAPQGSQQQGNPNDVQVGVPLGSDTDQQRQRQGGAGRQGGRGRQSGPPRPVPRTADGRVIIGSTPTEKGLWLPGPVVANQLGPVNALPFQPWARALVADRLQHRLEPHARCKASGVARQFLTPYGVEIVEIPELQRVFIFDVGGPHTWRTIYMDGRTHPKDLAPSYYGHSIGWWEGDTLVIETTGFNEGFWLDRDGLPHTEKLRTVERLTRTDLATLQYELTVEDPDVYTAPWKGRLSLRWETGTELFEYVCQEANYAPSLMVDQHDEVDRFSPIVP
jgi:hypothetical protein